MKGFHYLMKAGHFLNAMAVHSAILLEYVEDSGIRGFIARLNEALEGAPLDVERISEIAEAKHLWKLKAS